MSDKTSAKKTTKKQTPGVLDPVYALVGLTEVATDALRELGRPEGGRPESAPLFSRLRDDVVDIARGAARVPALAREEAQARYDEFSDRGQRAVSGVVPMALRIREEGRTAVDAQDAKARREARRLARQAGARVERGRSAVADVTKVAERTLGAVRGEAPVVDAVDHARGNDSSRVRRAAARRAAVSDTAVTSTLPTAADATGPERFSSVEAGSSNAARRAARTRRSATTSATSVVAKQAASAPADGTIHATTDDGTIPTPADVLGDLSRDA